MTPTPQSAATASAEAARLRAYLEQRLDAHFGTHRAIADVVRQPCQYTSSFRIDELDVRFEGGASLPLILKDLSQGQMMESARRGRAEFLYEPQREINAYQQILPDAPPGPPAVYDAVADPGSGRYWLLLERVSGVPLWQEGDVVSWKRTAEWIARFHGAFPPDGAGQRAAHIGAIVCDERWYWRWLQRAQQFAERDAARRQILDQVERGYARVIERLMSLPQTLIHGEFYPSNVIVSQGANVRVSPVDWEMIALGPALIDLAALTAGWADSTQRALARAYVAAANGGDRTRARQVRLSARFMTDLDCCRLYLAVRMLGWSNRWEPPREHAYNWLADADRISRRLEKHA